MSIHTGVNCWILERTADGKKRIVTLESIDEATLANMNIIQCSECETQMMLDTLKTLLA